MFDKPEICSKCGGLCCRTMPGSCFPEDFDIPSVVNRLKSALKSGKYSIDWWEGDPREDEDSISYGYFIRPATKQAEGRLLDPSWGGECTFLSNNGCALDSENRPRNCKMVEPVMVDGEFNCKVHNNSGKRGASLAWIPYHDLITKIINEIKEK